MSGTRSKVEVSGVDVAKILMANNLPGSGKADIGEEYEDAMYVC